MAKRKKVYTNAILVRFSDEEIQGLTAAASYYGIALSALVRRIASSWLQTPSSFSSNSSININVENTPTSEEIQKPKKRASSSEYLGVSRKPSTQKEPEYPRYEPGGPRMSDEEWAATQGLELARKKAAAMEAEERERRRRIEMAKNKVSFPSDSEDMEEYEDPEED